MLALAGGWLRKRGGGRWSSGFKRRWCELRQGPPRLEYYKSPKDLVARGSIPLRDADIFRKKNGAGRGGENGRF